MTNKPAKNNISEAVRESLENYFKQLEGEKPSCGLYDMLLNTVERPMLEVVMKISQDNQSRCAEILGINRNTLRHKLQKYGMIK